MPYTAIQETLAVAFIQIYASLVNRSNGMLNHHRAFDGGSAVAEMPDEEPDAYIRSPEAKPQPRASIVKRSQKHLIHCPFQNC